MCHLSDKTVLVTGATGGIGSAICHEFASRGAKIVALARDPDKTSTLLGALPTPDKHISVISDIQKTDTLASIGAEIAQQKPDIAIHALGGTLGIRTPNCEFEDWQKVFTANFHAIVSIDRAIIPGMSDRAFGRIIHLCSSSAFNCRGSIPYGSAKAALAHYSRSQGKRLAQHGLIMFGFCPGIVESAGNWAKAKTTNPDAYCEAVESQVLGRLQTPKEIASNLAFFTSEEASIYAGCIINADGSF